MLCGRWVSWNPVTLQFYFRRFSQKTNLPSFHEVIVMRPVHSYLFVAVRT